MKHDAPYYIKQCMSNQNTIDAQNVILKLDNTINFPKYPQFAYISLFVSPWCYIGIDLWPIFGLKKYSSSCEVGSFLYKFIWQIYSLKTNISGVSDAVSHNPRIQCDKLSEKSHPDDRWRQE